MNQNRLIQCLSVHNPVHISLTYSQLYPRHIPTLSLLRKTLRTNGVGQDESARKGGGGGFSSYWVFLIKQAFRLKGMRGELKGGWKLQFVWWWGVEVSREMVAIRPGVCTPPLTPGKLLMPMSPSLYPSSSSKLPYHLFYLSPTPTLPVSDKRVNWPLSTSYPPRSGLPPPLPPHPPYTTTFTCNAFDWLIETDPHQPPFLINLPFASECLNCFDSNLKLRFRVVGSALTGSAPSLHTKVRFRRANPFSPVWTVSLEM